MARRALTARGERVTTLALLATVIGSAWAKPRETAR
jgi:hypothetical protein